jgi:ubiquinone/menaquinone biosynthesis C-methylase UbiE
MTAGSSASRKGPAPGPGAEPVATHFGRLASARVWDELYDAPETAANVSFRVRLARTTELMPPVPVSVLDVGCGPAPLAPRLRAGCSYVGVDLVAPMLFRARERVPHARLVRSGASLPFRDTSFDVVVALGFLEYLDDIPAALGEMRRVVRRGGIVIASIPRKYHLDRAMIQLMTPLRTMVGSFLGKRSDSIRRTLLTASELDDMATGIGLRPTGGVHYHYLPLPYPLTVLMPRLSHRATRAMERWPGRAALSILAHGYLGRYQRD